MKPHRRFSRLCSLACLAAVPAALADTPGEPPPDAAPKSVEEKIDEVDQRVRILERKGEIEREKAADKTRETATIAAGRDGFVLCSADGDFQLYWYAWRFGLMAEWVRSSQEVDLDGVGDTLRNEAWQTSGSFLLTDDRASYRGVSPNKPIDGKGSGTGAVEVALRYGHLSIDDGTFPVFANIATSAREATEKAAGVNWYLNRNARVMLDFVRTSFRGGSATGDREDENVFLTRFQLAF